MCKLTKKFASTKKRSCTCFGFDCSQPHVVVISDIDGLDPIHSYTIIDNTQYLLETPIKAVDVYFKALYSLNLEYPVESNQLWCFIEHFFLNNVNP